ncbi:hypothetical protein [Tritonibacter sp. SIMBA_163]|uniref:hypothetical protein n=1 Tax=Tritonibacter sp. SIMBA_163 TaxID=3080868 RepID=UPI003980096C
MSEFVRLGDTTTAPVQVDLNMFERLTRGKHPWAQYDSSKKKVQRFGLCPECNNAMVLVNIHNPEPQVTPHGRHRLKRVDGFEYCLEEILGCPLLDSRLKSDLEADITALTPEAVELREFLVENFNLAAGMFAETTGISPSKTMLRKMLRLFFEDRWYRWPTVTKGNLPWTFARLTCNFNLYKQKIRPESAVWTAVQKHVPHAALGEYGRLEARGSHRVYLEFGLGQHKVRSTQDGRIRETISLHVLNTDPVAKVDEPVFETTLDLNTEEFLRRVAHKLHPAGYGAELVEEARMVLADYLHNHPEARSPEVET